MQLCRWLGFVRGGGRNQSVIHLIPRAVDVQAPYPVQCKLSLFSELFERKIVVLEGVRIGEPFPISLLEVFPSLSSCGESLCGVQVELSTHLSRLNLSYSHCCIENHEFLSQGSYRTVRFMAGRIQSPGSLPSPSIFFPSNADTQANSLICINAGVARRTLSPEDIQSIDEESHPLFQQIISCEPEQVREIAYAARNSRGFFALQDSEDFVMYSIGREAKTGLIRRVISLSAEYGNK